MTTIKPILKYPGSKARLAPWLHRYAPRLPHWQRVTMESRAEKGQNRTEVLWLNPAAAACADGVQVHMEALL